MSVINKIQIDNTSYDIGADYENISNTPTALSNFTNDENFIDNSVDNLINYTKSSELSNVATSGAYNDLSGKPDLSNFITNEVNNLLYYTLATATGSTIELSINSSTYVMTLNLKNSAGTTISTGSIDLPLESVVVNGAYDSLTKEVVLTLESGSTIRFSVADLVSGLQSELSSSNKLNADYIDDTNSTNKLTNATEKSTWNAKYDKPVSGIPETDLEEKTQEALQEVSKLSMIPNALPKITGTGTEITLNNTAEAEMVLEPSGNTTQGPNPSPSTPQTIYNVTGNNNIKIQNKNLANLTNMQLGKTLVGSGVGGDFSLTDNSKRSTIIVNVKPNTEYTISVASDYYLRRASEFASNNLTNCLADHTYYSEELKSTDTFTTTIDTNYFVIAIQTNPEADMTQQMIDNCQFMVEKNSTKTDYVTHKEQNYQLNIGNIEFLNKFGFKDKFYYANNKWYYTHYFNKIASYNGETITTEYYISTTGGLDTGATVYYYNGGNNPIEITDTTLISQLEAIYNEVYAYQDQTNITQTNDDLPFILVFETLQEVKNFSGSYNDLTDKPTIPDELSDLSDDSTHRLVTDTEKTTWGGKQDALVSGTNIKTINNTSVLGSGNIDTEIIQYSTMPTADSTIVGKIVQYTGTSGNGYTNGYFYIGTTDGGNPATYSWENINVQASGGGSLPDNTLPVYHIDGYKHTNSNSAFVLAGKPAGLYIIKASTNGTHNFYIKARTSQQVGKQIPTAKKIDWGMFYLPTVIPETYVEETTFYGITFSQEGDWYQFWATDKGTFINMPSTIKHFVKTDNTYAYTPSENYNPANKLYVDSLPTTYSGYDATKTQVLKNVNGTLTWVDEA